jgi:hypothetical protein
MTRDDLVLFAAKLRASAAVFGRRITDDVVTAYFRALSDVELKPLLRVLDRLVKTGESGTRFPTPGELRQRAGGTVTAPDQPLSDVALDRVRQAVLTALAPHRDADGDQRDARPTFDAAWKAARRREGWGGTVAQRETIWRAWCQRAEQPRTPTDGDADMTPAAQVAILRDVAARDAVAEGEFSRGGGNGRVGWMNTLADEIERRHRLSTIGGAFGEVVRTVVEGPDPQSPYWTDQRTRPQKRDRDPGEEG